MKLSIISIQHFLSSDFFKRNQVATMTMKDLFDFVTDPNITDKNMEACLDKLSERAATRQDDDLTQEEQVSEEVFKSAYIPQTLNEVPFVVLIFC